MNFLYPVDKIKHFKLIIRSKDLIQCLLIAKQRSNIDNLSLLNPSIVYTREFY